MYKQARINTQLSLLSFPLLCRSKTSTFYLDLSPAQKLIVDDTQNQTNLYLYKIPGIRIYSTPLLQHLKYISFLAISYSMLPYCSMSISCIMRCPSLLTEVQNLYKVIFFSSDLLFNHFDMFHFTYKKLLNC